ncbi:MAG: PorP/SprF family type IX secretion system membrane protein [Bacteroidales bacterium]|nr:PorP/SprF family type IX secretion system membrane protein [Bacteroidales bacterium]
MRKLLLLSTLLFLCGKGISQQVPLYSQYILNEFILNPAVAGIDGMTSVNFSGRKQWVGLKYAPETYFASISTRILKSPFGISNRRVRQGSKGRVGLGGYFLSDRNGAINRTHFQLTYAYHIFLQNYQLSFGLSAVTSQFKIDERLAELGPDDPLNSILGKSAYYFDANFGVNFATPKANIGLSVNQLIQSRLRFGEIDLDRDTLTLDHVRYLTLTGYYRLRLRNRNWEFEPSFLANSNIVSENVYTMGYKPNLQATVTGRFIYKREYWAGLSVRTTGDMILLMGLKVNKFYIGYSFDYGFSQVTRVSKGSHEVVLAIKFGDSTRRYRWLERY